MTASRSNRCGRSTGSTRSRRSRKACCRSRRNISTDSPTQFSAAPPRSSAISSPRWCWGFNRRRSGARASANPEPRDSPMCNCTSEVWSFGPSRNDGVKRSRTLMSFITGVGLTAYGRHEGSSGLDLMSKAAALAIADAGLKRADIDGILCGYSTVSPHIMLATVFAEHFGIRPTYAHAVQVGGATGLAMTMLAHHLVEAGVVRHVLVVGGENRLTGQSRDASMLALAQVGHPDYEVPLGPTIPAYYGLVASRYMHEYGVTEQDLAEFAVLLRAHALT